MRRRPFTVALTGGLAAGKSEALRAFARCGAWTLSLDELAHGLCRRGGPAYRSVVKAFGDCVLDENGEIGRRALASVVFGRPGRLKRLEAATHPHILREMRRRLACCRAAVAVVDVPLLFEKGLSGEFDSSVLLRAPAGLRLKRAALRGMSRADARRRMRAQWPQAKKEPLADVVLPNDNSPDDLRRAARELFRAFRLIATSPQGDR